MERAAPGQAQEQEGRCRWGESCVGSCSEGDPDDDWQAALRRPWHNAALLPTLDGYEQRDRIVSVCPGRALSAPVRACVHYALRAQGSTVPPLPGSLWEWPAMFADVWDIVATELGWLRAAESVRAAAEREARRKAEAGHGR